MKIFFQTLFGLFLSGCTLYGMEPPNIFTLFSGKDGTDSTTSSTDSQLPFSDEEFYALETCDEHIAAISMLLYGEGCPKNPEKALSYCLHCLKDFEDCEECEDGIIVGKYQFCIMAAQCYMWLGNLTEAEQMLDKIKKRTATILVIEGDLALRAGDIAEAQKKYEKAYAEYEYNLQACQRIYTCSQLGLPSSLYDKEWKNWDCPQWVYAMRSSNKQWNKEIKSYNPEDTELIFELYSDALEDAHAGIPAAMLYLSLIYKNGCGFIKKNEERAKHWKWIAEAFINNVIK